MWIQSTQRSISVLKCPLEIPPPLTQSISMALPRVTSANTEAAWGFPTPSKIKDVPLPFISALSGGWE